MMQHNSPAPATIFLARLMLVGGCVGILSLIASRGDGLPWWISDRIQHHGPMWGLGSLTLLLTGGGVLWHQSHPVTDWEPTVDGQRFRSLVLYSRQNCPLCDEALEVLALYRKWLPAVVEVDIDDDPELLERFGEWIPIVQVDGRVRFKGRVNEFLLRRLIEGSPVIEAAER